MGYRNKTYVIFDGDEDIWAYRFMRGWKQSEHIDFDFYDAHELKPMAGTVSEDYVKRVLRERLRNTKQAVVLIGESTKNLYKFIRWELETCQSMGIPIVAVNLGGKRRMDPEICPPILRGTPTMHVAFKMKIIKFALDDFCGNFGAYQNDTDWYYKDSVYSDLGL